MDEKTEFQVIINCSYTPNPSFLLNHEGIKKRTVESVDDALYDMYDELDQDYGYSFTVYEKPYSESAQCVHVDMVVQDEDLNKIM